MKKNLFLISLLLLSGCSSTVTNNSSSYNNGLYATKNDDPITSSKLVKEYSRYNPELGKNEKCRDFMNDAKAFDGEVKYIITTCQRNNGTWYTAAKKDIAVKEYINKTYCGNKLLDCRAIDME